MNPVRRKKENREGEEEKKGKGVNKFRKRSMREKLLYQLLFLFQQLHTFPHLNATIIIILKIRNVSKLKQESLF